MENSITSVNEKSVGKPYAGLDAWRGIASLLVVMCHASSTITGRFPELAGLPIYRAGSFGYLGVPLFFVISGFCIAGAACSTIKRGGSWWDFVRARLLRIYPACWASLILIGLFSVLARHLSQEGHLHTSALGEIDLLHQSALYFVANITLTQPLFHQFYLSVVCWTLSYELSFYLIVSLFLLKIARLSKQESLLSCLHGITLVSLLMLVVMPQFRIMPMDLWPQFGLGVLVYDVLKHPKETRPKVCLVAAALLVTCFLLVRHIPMGPQLEPSRVIFAVSLGFAALLLGLFRSDSELSQKPVIRQLRIIGSFSYSIYLIHFLVIGLISQTFRLMHITASLHLLLLFVYFVSAILVGRLFHQFFELPFMHVKPAPKPAAIPNERKRLLEDLAQL